MQLAIPRQPPHEPRAPLTPAAIKRLATMGISIVVESGTGMRSHISDQAYQDAGATVVSTEGESPPAIWSEPAGVITLGMPTAAQIAAMRPGALLVGMLGPLAHTDRVRELAAGGITAVSLEFVPRITRAQPMDVLSSQASIAGYKAVLLAAARCPKMFPMMITAAGTLAPARCFVIGAGVAGLQAIATARRLGAMVEAFDVRAVTKEQVESLGARFVELKTARQDDQATGGYARELTEEQRQQQTELMARHVISADVVVTTAAVFGKAPPLLIPDHVVAQMHPGAIIIDLAAAAGHDRGNCGLTRPGEVITTERGVVIDGTLNLPGTVPVHATQAYANNMTSLLGDLVRTTGEGDEAVTATTIDLTDEIQQGAVITHDGRIVNPMVQQAIEGA